MRAGDLAHAWTINARDLRQLSTPKHVGPRHLQRIWRGEPLDDARVLVRCYHGLGDTIQFIRFARPLRAIAREVIVWAQPELLTLISRCAGVDCAIPLHEGTPAAEFDVDIEVMELPFALRTDKEAVSADVPYIAAPGQPGQPLDPGFFHVGLVWSAGAWDTRRSIPLRLLAPLAELPHVRLHRLQPRVADEAPAPFALSDLTSPDIAGLAHNMSRLDLVITVDTMAAHLAGAMGIPVWTLLCMPCDWRWGEAGQAALWYPSMRLFRQSRASDWSHVIDGVGRTLAAHSDLFASEHRNGRCHPKL